jgi:hypothetical protein
VRANRQLATALRSQGLTDQADRFAYRAQALQGEALGRQAKLGAYVGSALLNGLSGYGYKPGRSLMLYLAMLISPHKPGRAFHR